MDLWIEQEFQKQVKAFADRKAGAKFQPGDLVKLRVGGPVMIVNAIGSDDRFQCVWFDRDNEAYWSYGGDYFAAAVLVPVESDGRPKPQL